MEIFVDTSAFLSLLNANDSNHAAAEQIWNGLADGKTRLLTTSYIVTASVALLQNRLGIEAVRIFNEQFYPLLAIVWVNEAIHLAGMSVLLQANRRKLSLVDCVSFTVCEQQDVDAVFAFDHHFIEQGFTCLT